MDKTAPMIMRTKAAVTTAMIQIVVKATEEEAPKSEGRMALDNVGDAVMTDFGVGLGTLDEEGGVGIDP